MKLVDLSDLVQRFLQDPNVSIPNISYWFIGNIGLLNITLNEATVYNQNKQEFSPELTMQQAEIFQYLYLVKYYTSQINNNLGAAAYDWSELQEGDSMIRKVSRNEIAKTYNTLLNSTREQLNMLIFWYKQNISGPASVAGTSHFCSTFGTSGSCNRGDWYYPYYTPVS